MKKRAFIMFVFIAEACFSLPLFALDFTNSEPLKEITEENSLREDENFETEPFFDAKEKKIKKYSDISAGKEHVKSKKAAEKSLSKNKKLFKKRIEKELYLLQIE